MAPAHLFSPGAARSVRSVDDHVRPSPAVSRQVGTRPLEESAKANEFMKQARLKLRASVVARPGTAARDPGCERHATYLPGRSRV